MSMIGTIVLAFVLFAANLVQVTKMLLFVDTSLDRDAIDNDQFDKYSTFQKGMGFVNFQSKQQYRLVDAQIF